jgi:hypothetical protein
MPEMLLKPSQKKSVSYCGDDEHNPTIGNETKRNGGRKGVAPHVDTKNFVAALWLLQLTSAHTISSNT